MMRIHFKMPKGKESKYIPALGFSWLTPYYDRVVRLTTREHAFKQALIKQADINSDQIILDLACGTGTLSIWMKEECPHAEIIGIDGDSEILSLAKHKANNVGLSIQFDKAMSYSLPFSDSYFDRIVSSLFFHHLEWEDKVRTAHEVYRVLKPGGQLHVADWGEASNILMRILFFLIQILDGFNNTQDNVSGKLFKLIEDAGFKDVSKRREFSTIFGTMTLYSASKPD